MSVNLLLLQKSFRTGWKRMALIASSVAIGILILFSFTAVFNAFFETSRISYSNSLSGSGTTNHQPIDGVDPVYTLASGSDALDGRDVSLIEMQKSDDNTPEILPGLEAPNPGEFYASPALVDYIKDHPDDHIEDRYGKLAGTLPEFAIQSRDTLLAIRGVDYPVQDGQLVIGDTTVDTNSVSIYQFSTEDAESLYDSSYDITTIVIYTGVIILLFPVVMLVSIATRLGSVQREQRYAALRLVGATNGQITGIIATESLLSTVVGITVGWGIYLLAQPLIAEFSIAGLRFWPSAVTVTTAQTLVIVILTLAMSLLANWWGMRNVRTSPLGISRRQKMEKKPGWWRALPLAVCLIVLVYMTVHEPANLDEATNMMYAFMLLILGAMFSLVIVTPWLTYRLAQLVARIAHHPTILIGAKYIQSHARAIARSVSGVVLALFAGSFYIMGTSGVGTLEAQSVRDQGFSILRDGTAVISGVNSDELADSLDKAMGQTDGDLSMVSSSLKAKRDNSYIVAQCLELNQYIDGLDCSHGQLAAVTFYAKTTEPQQILYGNTDDEMHQAVVDGARTLWDWQTDTDNEDSPDYTYLVTVADHDIDKLRSAIDKLQGGAQPLTGATVISASEAKDPSINPVIEDLANLAYAGMAVTMAVAIVSIVVSTIGGLLERRRSMYNLRLTGLQIADLKRVVIIESLIPLIVMSLVSAGLGAWSGIVFTLLGSTTLKPVITTTYAVVIVGSLILATIAIYLVLPMIGRLTNPENNQTE